MADNATGPLHPVTTQVTSLLERHGVWFEVFEHEPVKTSVEAANVRTGYGLHQGAKAIIVTGKREGVRQFLMLVFPANLRFSKPRVRDLLGVREFRFATREEIDDLTGGVRSGGIPPFGNLFGLSVVADPRLFENEKIIFNAGDRRFSVAMRSADYHRVVNPEIAEIAE